MVPAPATPLRVGHIEFLNCLPLYWGLDRLGLLPGLDLHPGTPDVLSDALVAGDLDVGPVSLVEALRASEELVVLPDVAVTADGPVESVVLLTRRPLADLHGRLVALGSTSRTSVLLARLLLERHVGVRPRYETVPPDLAAAAARGADAAVLIGDPALRASLAPPAGWSVVDLGERWQAVSGLPMVFAVWAARAEVVAAREGDVRRIGHAFAAGARAARRHPGAVARAAAARAGLPETDMGRYYRRLDFTFGPRQRAGLVAVADAFTGLGAVAPGSASRLRVLPDRDGPVRWAASA